MVARALFLAFNISSKYEICTGLVSFLALAVNDMKAKVIN